MTRKNIRPRATARRRSQFFAFTFAALSVCGLSPFLAEAEVEVLVNVLPERGMKFDAEAIYREDQEVIQGVLGSSGEDEVTALVKLPSGHLLMAGYVGRTDSALSGLSRLGCSEPGKRSGPFIAVTDGQFRQLYRVAFLPTVFSRIRQVALADDGSIFLGGDSTLGAGDRGLAVMKLPAKLYEVSWKASAPGDRVSGMALMPDGTVVVAPDKHPFISRIKADGSGLIPFGSETHFRTDGKNPQIYQKWWLDQKYPDSGVSSVDYHRGNAGGVGVTHDGNLVFLSSNFVRHKNGSPDFDPMLVKFTPEGEVLWATHLLEGLPALSDHKSPHLYVCPYSGDIIATMRQHGHFPKNLEVGRRAYLTTDNWLTGNIMIGWIGRVDPETGRLKAGTMYFPDLGRPASGGKRTANSLIPEDVRTDRDGNVYLIGKAAHKLATTIHAFQSEKMGDSGFISVFDPTLSRLLYANLITGHGHGYEPTALVVTELGPLVATRITPRNDEGSRQQLVPSNTDKTDFLSDRAAGGADVLFSLLPSAPWKEGW